MYYKGHYHFEKGFFSSCIVKDSMAFPLIELLKLPWNFQLLFSDGINVLEAIFIPLIEYHFSSFVAHSSS